MTVGLSMRISRNNHHSMERSRTCCLCSWQRLASGTIFVHAFVSNEQKSRNVVADESMNAADGVERSVVSESGAHQQCTDLN